MELTEIAEAARIHHFSVACDPDWRIAQSDQEPYKRSLALMKAAIAAAWPALSTEAIYDTWLDSFCTLTEAADYVHRMSLIEIGARTDVQESAGGDAGVYRKSWWRSINGTPYRFVQRVDANRFSTLTVGNLETGEQVHRYEWRVKEMPGLVNFSLGLGKMFL